MSSKIRIPIVGMIGLGLAFFVAVSAIGVFNALVTLDQGVDAQWGQVESAYQRRFDLVPNLVETVKGAAAFERETLTQVVEARSRATQVSANLGKPPQDAQQFEEYQKAQDALTSSLSRLLVVVERYPELSATAQFRDLASQLEGTENRINVERMRFNDAAREYNTACSRFPNLLVVTLFRNRFKTRAYFKATTGAEIAPQVSLGS